MLPASTEHHLSIRPAVAFYVVGFAVGVELVVVGLLGLGV